jgi:hypothetical protein
LEPGSRISIKIPLRRTLILKNNFQLFTISAKFLQMN